MKRAGIAANIAKLPGLLGVEPKPDARGVDGYNYNELNVASTVQRPSKVVQIPKRAMQAAQTTIVEAIGRFKPPHARHVEVSCAEFLDTGLRRLVEDVLAFHF